MRSVLVVALLMASGLVPAVAAQPAAYPPGVLGKARPDADIGRATPAQNIRDFRRSQHQSGGDCDVNWAATVECEESDRARFYDVAGRAANLITPADVQALRREEADIASQTCGNYGYDARRQTYPGLTDAWCKAHGYDVGM